MIHLNEAYPMPTGAVRRARRTSSHPWSACRTIKPAPVRMHVQFDVEPNEDDRIVHADVQIEMVGLEADLLFRDPPGALDRAEGTAGASARLLHPGECFIPPRSAASVPASAGALLGVELRDGELAPLGRVLPIPPVREGTASVEASFDVLAAIGVAFSWVDSSPGPEILLGGEIRFLRGVVGRLMFRTESPSRLTSRRRLSMKDIPFLRPGQVIHFPEQFIPVSGGARDLARIHYTFGGASRPGNGTT